MLSHFAGKSLTFINSEGSVVEQTLVQENGMGFVVIGVLNSELAKTDNPFSYRSKDNSSNNIKQCVNYRYTHH